MNVLMLGWEFPPDVTGGLGAACRDIAVGLVRDGVQVTFVVPRAPRASGKPSEPIELLGADQVALPRRRLRYSSWREPSPSDVALELLAIDSPLRPYERAGDYARRQHRVEGSRRPRPAVRVTLEETGELEAPYPFQGGYGKTLFEEIERFARVVAELARRRRFDCIHAHDWMTWPAALLVAERTGLPLLLHVHSTELDRGGERPDPYIREVEELALQRATRVICVSHYTADILRRRYGVDPSRVDVVHNAPEERNPVRFHHLARNSGSVSTVPTEAAETNRVPFLPLVIWIGRLTRQKGPEHFLEAAALVHDVSPDVQFAICGDGELLPDLVARVRRIGLTDCVRFTGFLDREGVQQLFERASVHVMPSVSEPFGLVAIEAAEADVPVIVSNQSGVGEVLSSALRVDWWDVRGLADKILAVLRQPSLRSALVVGARSELAQLRERGTSRSLREIYATVTGGGLL